MRNGDRRQRLRIALRSLVVGLVRILVVGKRPDLSTKLYVDASLTRHKEVLAELGDTHGPEFESGKVPFGAAHNLRVSGVVLGLWLLILFATIVLIIEYGGPPFYDSLNPVT